MNIVMLSNCALVVSRPVMNEMLRFPASLHPGAPRVNWHKARANWHKQSWFRGRLDNTQALENYAAHKHLLYQHSGYLL